MNLFDIAFPTLCLFLGAGLMWLGLEARVMYYKRKLAYEEKRWQDLTASLIYQQRQLRLQSLGWLHTITDFGHPIVKLDTPFVPQPPLLIGI